MPVNQDAFTHAMLDPGAAVPEGLCNPDGAQANKRFDVYRNNVAVSLTEALETAFPVIAKLVGADNFRLLAGTYLRQHPPGSPLMMFYGAEMPDFLANFAPVASLPYLPDVARLELALRQAYHAADAAPPNAAVLQELPPDRLMAARLRFAPAVQLLRSPFPISAIWHFNMENGPKPTPQGENVLVSRPEYDPIQTLLPPGGGTFIAALLARARFGDALQAATDRLPDFDLTPTLSALLAAGALTHIDED